MLSRKHKQCDWCERGPIALPPMDEKELPPPFTQMEAVALDRWRNNQHPYMNIPCLFNGPIYEQLKPKMDELELRILNAPQWREFMYAQRKLDHEKQEAWRKQNCDNQPPDEPDTVQVLMDQINAMQDQIFKSQEQIQVWQKEIKDIMQRQEEPSQPLPKYPHNFQQSYNEQQIFQPNFSYEHQPTEQKTESCLNNRMTFGKWRGLTFGEILQKKGRSGMENGTTYLQWVAHDAQVRSQPLSELIHYCFQMCNITCGKCEKAKMMI
jgi:hypothetical protein